MKEKLAKIEAEGLVEKLLDAPFAFAAWRLPNSNQKHFIVALDSPIQTNESISDLSPGFLFNRFSDNHPAHPFHIKADLLFTDQEVTVDPRVSSDKIDSFLNHLNSREINEKAIKSSIVETTGYEQLVAEGIEAIRKGAFEKVVLARYQDEILPDDFVVSDFYETICKAYPHSFCSMVYVPKKGVWMGASPETLLSATDHSFKTISLAGTKKLEEGQSLSQIAWTQKEIEEQAFVSRYIVNCFKKIRLREFSEHGPKTVQAGNLAHLRTDFGVNLDETQFESLAEQMLELLHPTSAVCGMPLDASKKFIEKREGFDREFYAGFLGPVNFEGSTDLFVNLRCMKVDGGIARFYAGAGITEDSIPEHELLETQLKMSVLKSLI